MCNVVCLVIDKDQIKDSDMYYHVQCFSGFGIGVPPVSKSDSHLTTHFFILQIEFLTHCPFFILTTICSL
jgi:hypothetical protein